MHKTRRVDSRRADTPWPSCRKMHSHALLSLPCRLPGKLARLEEEKRNLIDSIGNQEQESVKTLSPVKDRVTELQRRLANAEEQTAKAVAEARQYQAQLDVLEDESEKKLAVRLISRAPAVPKVRETIMVWEINALHAHVTGPPGQGEPGRAAAERDASPCTGHLPGG